MRATFKLLSSYFWKTFYGPIFAFIFPIIVLAIFGNIFRIEYIYPGIIAMSLMFINMLSLPLAIMELKQTSIFKYIGSTNVNPIKFTFVVIGFYTFISLITLFVIILSTMLLWMGKVFPGDGFYNGILGSIFLSWTGSIGFYLSFFIHLLFVITTGVLISSFSKRPQQALTIGLIIIIPSIFLSGMVISVDIIAKNSILNWVSRFIPYRYSTGNIIISSTPLDQIGNFLNKLSVSEKEVIFKDVDPISGKIWFEVNDYQEIQKTKIEIKNLEELKTFRITHGDGNFINNINDMNLYKLIFEGPINQNFSNSDNNIFNVNNSWSVRRVPDIDSIKSFIKAYFMTLPLSEDGDSARTASNLRPIVNQILKGDFEWFNIFLKQSNVLYYPFDRILNFFIPGIFTSWMFLYIYKNFSWSNR